MLTEKEKKLLEVLKKSNELAIFEATGKRVTINYKIIDETPQRFYTPEEITDIVCRQLNVDYTDIFAKTRKHHIVEARQIATYLVYNKCGLSLTQCGRFFNRHHSTILYSKKIVGSMLQVYQDYRIKFNSIELEIAKLK
jgi:chromosomal replication initiation ATPase DnaA